MSTKCMLLQLPNEMLLRIVELFASDSGIIDATRSTAIPQGFPALARTCRRLNLMIIPRLYEELEVFFPDTESSPEAIVVSLLHRTFETTPALRSLCRRLTLVVERGSGLGSKVLNPHIRMIADFTTWLNSVTELTMSGRMIVAWRTGLTLPNMVEALDPLCGTPSSIRSLRVQDVVTDRSGFGQWAKLRSMKHMGPFEELHVYGWSSSYQMFHSLIMWPKRLTTLNFIMPMTWDVFARAGVREKWDLEELEPILRLHKSTLIELTVGTLEKSDLSKFNISDYPALKYLGLSYGATRTETAFLENILPQTLKVFCWDLAVTRFGVYNERLPFDEPEEQFLEVLISKARERKVELEKIVLHFRQEVPRLYGYDLDQLASLAYPWDRVDEIARRTGMCIEYNEPPVTRDQLKDWTKSLREELEAALETG